MNWGRSADDIGDSTNVNYPARSPATLDARGLDFETWEGTKFNQPTAVRERGATSRRHPSHTAIGVVTSSDTMKTIPKRRTNPVPPKRQPKNSSDPLCVLILQSSYAGKTKAYTGGFESLQ
jgi:hypothetical protein